MIDLNEVDSNSLEFLTWFKTELLCSFTYIYQSNDHEDNFYHTLPNFLPIHHFYMWCLFDTKVFHYCNHKCKYGTFFLYIGKERCTLSSLHRYDAWCYSLDALKYQTNFCILIILIIFNMLILITIWIDKL